MSIINEALKKAGQEKGSGSFLQNQDTAKKNLEFEMEKKKSRVNWGPIFVLLVLFLITGPIIIPIFSSPFRKSNFINETGSAPRTMAVANLPAQDLSLNRKAQFGIEEAAVFQPAAKPVTQMPYLKLSGLVYSAKDSYCIVNDRIVKIGENVEGAKLVNITPQEAVLEYQGEKIILSVTH